MAMERFCHFLCEVGRENFNGEFRSSRRRQCAGRERREGQHTAPPSPEIKPDQKIPRTRRRHHDGGRCRPETHEMCGRHAGSDRSSIRIRACPVHRRDKAHRITFPLLSQEEEEAAPHHREREVPQNPIHPRQDEHTLAPKCPSWSRPRQDAARQDPPPGTAAAKDQQGAAHGIRKGERPGPRSRRHPAASRLRRIRIRRYQDPQTAGAPHRRGQKHSRSQGAASRVAKSEQLGAAQSRNPASNIDPG